MWNPGISVFKMVLEGQISSLSDKTQRINLLTHKNVEKSNYMQKINKLALNDPWRMPIFGTKGS